MRCWPSKTVSKPLKTGSLDAREDEGHLLLLDHIIPEFLLMNGPEEKVSFLLPRISMFPRDELS